MASVQGAPHRGVWYYGWNIIAVAVLSQVAANGLAINAFSLFLHDWSKQLHSPISTLQLAIVPLAFVAAVLSPVVGTLADKYPARLLFGAGLFGIAIFTFAMSWATATWQIQVLYGILLPVSLSLCTSITANAVVSRWFMRRVGLAMGITAFGVGMAGVLLPPVIAWAMPIIGWRGVWRTAGLIIALVVLPIVMLVLRERPTEREGLHYVTGEGVAQRHHGHGHGGAQDGGLRWRDIVKRKNFWLLAAVFLPILAIYGGCVQNLAPIAASHGFSPQSAGLLLSVLSLSHIASTLLLGTVSDRYGNRLPFAGLAVIVAGGAVLVAFSGSLPAMIVAVAFVGLGGGLWTLLAAAIAVEFGASGVGRAFGLMMAFIPINAMAPFLIAKTQETTGSYAAPLLTLAAIALAGGGLCLLMRERRGGPPATGKKDAVLGEAFNPTA